MDGLNLKLERTKQRLSQFDLATLTGIANYKISLIENDRAKASLDETELLEKALQVPLESKGGNSK